jgi:hypothetical protein
VRAGIPVVLHRRRPPAAIVGSSWCSERPSRSDAHWVTFIVLLDISSSTGIPTEEPVRDEHRSRFERLFRSEADAVRAFPAATSRPTWRKATGQRSLSAVEAKGTL